MKKILLALSFGCVISMNAQNFVSTNDENKKAIMEEFTGTACTTCPPGHLAAAGLLSNHPGNLFVVAYHPAKSTFCVGDPMAQVFPNAFWGPFIAPLQGYMPSAIINRRNWDANGRISAPADWSDRIDTILSEPAPVNVAVRPTYNNGSKMLTVTVEVYFTANVNNQTTLNVFLSESGIVANQSGIGGGPNYVHDHAFRHAFTAQWGNAIAFPTSNGSFKTYTYTFDNSTTNYDMTKCEVVAAVRNVSTEELLNANGYNVSITTGTTSLETANSISVFPNPVNAQTAIKINLAKESTVNYSIMNVMGQKVVSEDLGILSAGNHSLTIGNKTILAKGIYFINATIDGNSFVEKIIVE